MLFAISVNDFDNETDNDDDGIMFKNFEVQLQTTPIFVFVCKVIDKTNLKSHLSKYLLSVIYYSRNDSFRKELEKFYCSGFLSASLRYTSREDFM